MSKLLIEKKYNKQLNIFLGIYITLCLIFALLFNGFFVKSKAFTSNTSWELKGTCINNEGYGTVTQIRRYTVQNENKAIYYTDPDFIELLNNELKKSDPNLTVSCVCVQGFGEDATTELVSSIGNGTVPPFRNTFVTVDSGTVYSDYFVNKDIDLGRFQNRPWYVTFMVNGTPLNSPGNVYSAEFFSDVQYVDNAQDLYKYLVQNDDSVVNVGNPDEIPQAPEDNALPLPQQLKFIEGSNKDYATSIDRYLVSVGWNNPQSASFDAYTNIRAEIKYKVKFKAQSGTLFLNKGTYTTDYVDSTFKLSNSAISNHYVTKYDSVGYAQPNENIPDSDKNPKYMSGIKNYIYQDSLLNNAMLQVINANDLKYFPLYTYNIIEGTQLSMRYIGTLDGKDYSSLWVTVNYSGSAITKDKITFENASGDPISPNDVDYSYDSNSSANDTDFSITGIFQNLGANISSVFTTIRDFFGNSDSGSSDFYSFFGKVFNEFPGFFALFLLGLALAIILRILGR